MVVLLAFAIRLLRLLSDTVELARTRHVRKYCASRFSANEQRINAAWHFNAS